MMPHVAPFTALPRAGHLVPVLEIGGTHVTAAAVDLLRDVVVPGTTLSLGRLRSAGELLDRFAEAMGAVRTDGTVWGAAIPGPFDYRAGIGRYRDVGKFDALDGVDVRGELRSRLGARATELHFLNDADAALLGEVAAGHCAGHRRCVGITLGTGVGSGFVVDGALVTDGPGVPPDGEAHLLDLDGVPLEEIMSRRAILRAWAQARPDEAQLDVRDIASLARDGDPDAVAVLADALRGLTDVLRPCLQRFGASLLVVGGSIARSWDLVAPALRAGLGDDGPELQHCPDSERAALLGAAALVTQRLT